MSGYLIGPDGKIINCAKDNANEEITFIRILRYVGPRWWVEGTLSESIRNKRNFGPGTVEVILAREEKRPQIIIDVTDMGGDKP